MKPTVPARAAMSPTEDPSIFTHEGKRYHIPGSRPQKIAYVFGGLLCLTLGIWFSWDALGRLLLGQTSEARVVRIVKVVPGAENTTFRYRRALLPERDRSITFQHYVEVTDGVEKRVLRLGVDSRVQPYANVNDRLTVCYYPNDSYAFVPAQARTWGIGALYGVIGLAFVAMGLPMLLAVGKPIEIDPEAQPAPPA
jgi:hypothetical protein